MTSIFDGPARAALAARLDAITPESVARWGRMDSAAMLAHLAESLRMALGELPVRPRGRLLRLPPLRHAIIHWLPFPKGAPTAPELVARRAEDIAAEIRAVKTLLEELAGRATAPIWPEHPAFGRLSARDWGALVYRHIDHHLRQFGA